MLSERIRALIREFNPWWEGKEVAVPVYKRHLFSGVQKYMNTKQIISIVGLRRVGKTVLMKQIIKELVDGGERKENVFYFLFDDIVVQNPDVLEDILDFYLKTIAKHGKKHIFLDEIQKVPFWQDILKRFFDTTEDVKFVVSGSSSLRVKKSKESLAGRIFDFYLPILTFREFLELNDVNIEKAALDFDTLQERYEANIHKKTLLEDMLLKYLFRGAFPELAKEEDEGIIKSYVRSSVVEKIILEDIPAVFEVKRKDVMSAILEFCSRETSNLLDITNLAKTLATNYQTARSYIFYLKNSFVIDIVYNYSKSIAKQLRKNKKIHIAHPSITMATMGYSMNMLDTDEITGRYMETVVFQHAKALSERISFWRSPQKEEVDIVLEGKALLPIEVKYRNDASSGSIITFMKKHRLKNGIVVTKDVFDRKRIDGREVLFIPAWLFLLCV